MAGFLEEVAMDVGIVQHKDPWPSSPLGVGGEHGIALGGEHGIALGDAHGIALGGVRWPDSGDPPSRTRWSGDRDGDGFERESFIDLRVRAPGERRRSGSGTGSDGGSVKK